MNGFEVVSSVEFQKRQLRVAHGIGGKTRPSANTAGDESRPKVSPARKVENCSEPHLLVQKYDSRQLPLREVPVVVVPLAGSLPAYGGASSSSS